jgi:hypothetical protein
LISKKREEVGISSLFTFNNKIMAQLGFTITHSTDGKTIEITNTTEYDDVDLYTLANVTKVEFTIFDFSKSEVPETVIISPDNVNAAYPVTCDAVLEITMEVFFDDGAESLDTDTFQNIFYHDYFAKKCFCKLSAEYFLDKGCKDSALKDKLTDLVIGLDAVDTAVLYGDYQGGQDILDKLNDVCDGC